MINHYSLSLQGEPEDKLALLIAEQLGSESLAPKFRKSVESKQKVGSRQQRAVPQLQHQLDLLKVHEAAAANVEYIEIRALRGGSRRKTSTWICG